MQLPIQLKQAIEQQAATINTAQLAKAASALSENYRFRQGTGEKFIASETHRLAYIVTRMPATFAAIHHVMSEVKRRAPNYEINSLLDLGAGPGTVAWAASEVFPALQTLTMLEQDSALIRLGKLFGQRSNAVALQTAEWHTQNLATTKSLPAHDAVISSYSLNELALEQARTITRHAWEAAQKLLVLIEPGTQNGFGLIQQLRADLLQLGGHPIAPCPHANECPMPENDWCHFAARVERTALHRKLKAGALNYEDEKFSYLVFAKEALPPASARIIRHPHIHSGYVKLQLCNKEGLQEITVTQKQKENFKKARKANWGAAWEMNDEKN